MRRNFEVDFFFFFYGFERVYALYECYVQIISRSFLGCPCFSRKKSSFRAIFFSFFFFFLFLLIIFAFYSRRYGETKKNRKKFSFRGRKSIRLAICSFNSNFSFIKIYVCNWYHYNYAMIRNYRVCDTRLKLYIFTFFFSF